MSNRPHPVGSYLIGAQSLGYLQTKRAKSNRKPGPVKLSKPSLVGEDIQAIGRRLAASLKPGTKDIKALGKRLAEQCPFKQPTEQPTEQYPFKQPTEQPKSAEDCVVPDEQPLLNRLVLREKVWRCPVCKKREGFLIVNDPYRKNALCAICHSCQAKLGLCDF